MNGSKLIPILEMLGEAVQAARDLRESTTDVESQKLYGEAQTEIFDCYRQIGKLITRVQQPAEIQRVIGKHFGS